MSERKRYLLFAGIRNQSYGGMNDFIGHFDKKSDIFRELKRKGYDSATEWYQIVSAYSLQVLEEGNCQEVRP